MNRILYRPVELIELLALSRSSVYKLIETGQLASIQIGRSRRVTAEALSKWIEQRQTGS